MSHNASIRLRRLLTLLAIPALAVSLAACDPDDSADPPTTEGTTSHEEPPASEEPESPGTVIQTQWIDDSWTIEQVDDDLCEMGGGYPSQYPEQEDIFVCGPTAAGAEACALDDGTVQCIVDPLGKQAIEFDSPTAPEQLEPREDEALPLLVELPDGAVCATIAQTMTSTGRECSAGTAAMTAPSC